ncbi:hypothetical protein ABC304_02070 [Microbacterium sp. 1P10UB]|uniref:hypothetical protein n=1 Tax=unclassified Microbacterium TaxID=2609290 RepID=UPI0039A30571
MTAPTTRTRRSKAVYRRRRLALLLAVLVAVALVWVLVAQPWRGSAQPTGAAVPAASASRSASPTEEPVPDEAPDATPTPTSTPADAAASASPAPSPSATATPAPEPCRASDVTVQARTDQDTYAAGQNPQLSITLTNNSAVGCTMNVGTTTQKFTVKSGEDVWWRSTDCQTEPSDMVVLIAPGQSVSSATPLVWDRTRSSVSSCDATDRQRAPGGGASYFLSVEIGGVASTDPAQMLLY